MRRLKAFLIAGTLALMFVIVVELRSAYFRIRMGCAIVPWIHPLPHTPVRDADYVELGVLPGYSPYHRFKVRLWGSGRLYRDDLDCPLGRAKTFTSVDPDEAKQLVKATEIALCSMCSSYAAPEGVLVADAGASRITISTTDLTKTVREAGGEPGQAYRDLSARIKEISGIDPFVDTSQFSPERKAACDAPQQAERSQRGWFPSLP